MLTSDEWKDADHKSIIKDGVLTESEWNDLNADTWFSQEMIPGLPNWGFLCCIGGIIVIGIIVYCLCKKKNPNQIQHNDDNPLQHEDSHGHGRRRLHHVSPIVSLAHEAGCDVLETSSLPVHGRKLAENQLPKLIVSNDPWGLPGLNDHNLWWIVPVSCLTQLMWIYVSYRIYKRCAQSTRQSENAPRHELREITVRR